MDDNERVIWRYLLHLERLGDVGSDAVGIERDLWIHAVVLAGLVWLVGRGHPIVMWFALASAALTLFDLVFWLIGLGSVITLLNG